MKKKTAKWTATVAAIFVVLAIIVGASLGSNDDNKTSTAPVSEYSETIDESSITSIDTTSKTAKETTKNQEKTTEKKTAKTTAKNKKKPTSLTKLPEYNGSPYVAVNNNEPFFTKSDLTKKSYEKYSNLDSLGRCKVAIASVGKDIMPTEKRGAIGSVKPTGWHTVKYSNVDGKYLYNRCHLIGYQLTGENANVKNLITGTRYLNVDGMLPFENMVADYVKETGNHVLYRVTPKFKGNELVARGVEIEAKSVEDNGDGILFNVYCFNVQPSVKIDYATGESSGSSKISGTANKSSSAKTTAKSSSNDKKSSTYILNTNTKKFHLPSCSSVSRMKSSNKETYKGSRSSLISKGYEPCKICNP